MTQYLPYQLNSSNGMFSKEHCVCNAFCIEWEDVSIAFDMFVTLFVSNMRILR